MSNELIEKMARAMDLVIAARIVAFADQSEEALRELDRASEAFAAVVPWEIATAREAEALRAENERLREALGLIIENESPDTGYGNSSAKIARAALKGSQ